VVSGGEGMQRQDRHDTDKFDRKRKPREIGCSETYGHAKPIVPRVNGKQGASGQQPFS